MNLEKTGTVNNKVEAINIIAKGIRDIVEKKEIDVKLLALRLETLYKEVSDLCWNTELNKNNNELVMGVLTKYSKFIPVLIKMLKCSNIHQFEREELEDILNGMRPTNGWGNLPNSRLGSLISSIANEDILHIDYRVALAFQGTLGSDIRVLYDVIEVKNNFNRQVMDIDLFVSKLIDIFVGSGAIREGQLSDEDIEIIKNRIKNSKSIIESNNFTIFRGREELYKGYESMGYIMYKGGLNDEYFDELVSNDKYLIVANTINGIYASAIIQGETFSEIEASNNDVEFIEKFFILALEKRGLRPAKELQ